MAKSSKGNNSLKDTKYEELARELRTQSRELREIRKTLKEILEIFKCNEADAIAKQLPEWAKGDLKAIRGENDLTGYGNVIEDVIIEDEFIDVRDLGVTS